MIYLLLTILAGALAYVALVRPWQVRWGATDTEVRKSLPGDEVVPSPSFNATRAVTIHAPCEAIWPWIIQIGSGRAGWYSIDWIDNARMPSAEAIMPEFQRMEVGDFVPMTPDGKNGMWVRDCATGEFMLWHAKGDTSTWLWWLEPVDAHNTRLITRLRVRYDWTSIWVIYYLLQDVGDIVMMRKSMLGIKRRAEALASHDHSLDTDTSATDLG